MNVYIASPFFTESQLHNLKGVEEVLRSAKINFFSPRLSPANTGGRETIADDRRWSIETFHDDIKRLHWADVILCVYEGMYSDSGTAMEVGYAYALGKPIIVIHAHNEENFSNLMVHESAYANLTLNEFLNNGYDFKNMPTNYWNGKCR